MKKLVSLLMMLVFAQVMMAQNVLQVTDVSQPNDVYTGDNDKAVVIVKCNKSIPLTFTSTMDKSADPYNVATEGSDCVYYIEFPTGSKYRGRALSIMSPGYSTVTVDLEDIQPKQVLTFQAVDPNSSVDAGCYRGHRNKGMEELKNMNYQEARDQFEVARDCSDVDTLENNSNIALVDSLIYNRNMGEENYKLLNYSQASRYFNRVMNLNPYDTFASNRYNNCITKFVTECEMDFKQAEYYFNDKQYEKAKFLYERVVRNDCATKVQAQEQVNRIDNLINQKKDHARVFTYEYVKDTPVGFSYGKYNMHKVGGFFQMSINNKVFEMMRNDCAIPDAPEINVGFGWTVKIANPVWVFFGPGATTKFYYGDYSVDEDQDEIYPNKEGFPDDPNGILKPSSSNDSSKKKKKAEYTADDEKVNAAWAISPVMGICVKYSYFAVRFTYQYRFAMDSHLKDYMGTQKFSIGVGVSF